MEVFWIKLIVISVFVEDLDGITDHKFLNFLNTGTVILTDACIQL